MRSELTASRSEYSKPGNYVSIVLIGLSFVCLFKLQAGPNMIRAIILYVLVLINFRFFAVADLLRAITLIVLAGLCAVLFARQAQGIEADQKMNQQLQAQLQDQLREELPLVQKLCQEQKDSGYKLVRYQGTMQTH